MTPAPSAAALLAAGLALALGWLALDAQAKVTFEKMTNRDYSGLTYYTIQNVSLFECLGWCKEEASCSSAVFSFVVNPFAALQETTCQLQNETQARQGAYLRSMPGGEQVPIVAQPQKATNLYFFNKLELASETLCQRLWAFERFPNRRLRQRDRPAFHAASKESCQAACMNEQRFVCRSAEYNYLSQQCSLNGLDRRSPLTLQAGQPDLLEAAGTDYFENACLLSEDICQESRVYDYAKLGLPLARVAHFVELNYYPDKEMLVKSQAGCVRACSIEHEFICRSILYRSSFKPGQPNCALYHLDQKTFPEGADTFASQPMQPLLDSGESSAVYLEAVCNDSVGSSAGAAATTVGLAPASITILPGAAPSSPAYLAANQSQPGEERYLASSSSASPASSTLSPLTAGPPTTIRLPSSFLPPKHISLGPGAQAASPGPPSRITLSPAPAPQRDASLLLEPAPGGLHISGAQGAGASHDQNCDAHGFCYDVALKCTDTKMLVNVKTQRPFFGRIYALGRSETCNANIKNQNQFQLDLQLTGQDCNTQSASGTYTNTIVLQHHNVVLTKADKVYHVRCTYETASRNVSFGMMPVKDMFEVDVNDRNQETISITASSDAPLPKIQILTLDGKEASTVRIGDRLTFRVEIPDNTPYGIFARSCVAMAKDARSTFEIIDENGCPVDHTIFPNFLPVAGGSALESNYEAFRFTESYGVIFQCNVKYCIGKCEPVNCGIGRDSVEAWGRRKRSLAGPERRPGKPMGDDMTLSREIVVLDLKEKEPGEAGAEPDAERAEPDERRSPLRAAQTQPADAEPTRHCLSGQSLLVLVCSLGLVFVLYVCLVAYFFARRQLRVSPIKHQYQ